MVLKFFIGSFSDRTHQPDEQAVFSPVALAAMMMPMITPNNPSALPKISTTRIFTADSVSPSAKLPCDAGGSEDGGGRTEEEGVLGVGQRAARAGDPNADPARKVGEADVQAGRKQRVSGRASLRRTESRVSARAGASGCSGRGRQRTLPQRSKLPSPSTHASFAVYIALAQPS